MGKSEGVDHQKEAKNLRIKDEMLLSTVACENRLGGKALSRRLYAEWKQANYAKGFTKAQEAMKWRRKEVMQDVALAQQILADRIEEDQIENHRHLLRENEEMKELTSCLKAAYAQKELYTQLEAKKAEKVKFELENKEEFYRLKAVEESMNKKEEELRIETANRKREYKEFLQDQMIEKHKQKIEEYKQSITDRAIMDDSLKVAEELEKNKQESHQHEIQKALNELEEFNKSKKYWMAKEKEKELEEERKVKDYLEDKFQKEQRLQEMARQKELLKLKYHELVVNNLISKTQTNDEEAHINQILLDESTRLKELANEQAKIDKEIRTRQELREVFKKQVEDKMKSLEEERKRDYEYCLMMQKELEEQKRNDQEIQAKKRQQKLKYANDLKQVIEEHDRQRQEDLYRKIKEYQTNVQTNKDRLKEIDDERLRILHDHANHLLGFLPKGVIRKSDLPHLDTKVQEFYNFIGSKP